MPAPCDSLYQTYLNLYKTYEAAYYSLSSAQKYLASANQSYSGALAAEAACIFLAEVPPAFAACLLSTYINAKACEKAVDAAKDAVTAAQINYDQAKAAADAALSAYCKCVQGKK